MFYVAVVYLSRDAAHPLGSADIPGTVTVAYAAASYPSRDAANMVPPRYINILKTEILYFGAVNIPEQALKISGGIISSFVDEKIVNDMARPVKITLKRFCGVCSYSRPLVVVKVKVLGKGKIFPRVSISTIVDRLCEVRELGPGAYEKGFFLSTAASGKIIGGGSVPEVGRYCAPSAACGVGAGGEAKEYTQ
jgi:hypothetical protein